MSTQKGIFIISKEQLQTVFNLIQELKWKPGILTMTLKANFNVTTPQDLTQMQASNLIKALQKRLNEKKREEVENKKIMALMESKDKKFMIYISSIVVIVISIILINSSHIVRIIFVDEDTGKLDFGSLSFTFLILIGLLALCLYFILKKHDELYALKHNIAILFKKEDAKRHFRFTEEDIKEFYYDAFGEDYDREDKANIVWEENRKDDDDDDYDEKIDIEDLE